MHFYKIIIFGFACLYLIGCSTQSRDPEQTVKMLLECSEILGKANNDPAKRKAMERGDLSELSKEEAKSARLHESLFYSDSTYISLGLHSGLLWGVQNSKINNVEIGKKEAIITVRFDLPLSTSGKKRRAEQKIKLQAKGAKWYITDINDFIKNTYQKDKI